MSARYLPIKIFEKRKGFDDRDTEAGGGGSAPKWILSGEELKLHSAYLQGCVSKVEEAYKRHTREKKLPMIISARLRDDAIAKSYRGRIVNVLESDNQDNVIGFYGDRCILSMITSEVILHNVNLCISDTQMEDVLISSIDALLYFIDDLIKKNDSMACSSFIFFKGDYSDLKKQELELLSKRLISSISIGDNVVLEGQDFEYIWRWLFYQRIIEDNEEYNNRLFVNDEKWNMFQNAIKKIKSEKKKKFLSIPAKVTLSVPYTDTINQTSIAPKAEVDFLSSKVHETKNYRLFVQIIEEADSLFSELTRTDVPYYIFIDELEAYYGDEKIFKRDLRLIRDLIFTVKKINAIFATNRDVKSKIICSVRTEILNAITRFIVTKELNKVTSGYEIPLMWDYTNTNSFEHPILKVLVKRIEFAEKKGAEYINEKELINRWFPEKINNNEPASYILNNSWCKPRDIVRLILAAQNCLASTNNSFSQATIDLCHRKYSMDSLVEIKEEMRALYSADEINIIFNSLTGFKSVFTVSDLERRINRYYKGTVWEDKFNTILSDLYRLGIIGNYSPASKSYRWQHKGDDGLILSDEWKIMIHSALQSALSVNRKQDKVNTDNSLANLKEGEIINVKVIGIVKGFAIVSFMQAGVDYVGSVHISQLSRKYNNTIEEVVSIGDEHDAKVLGYDIEHNKWRFTFII